MPLLQQAIRSYGLALVFETSILCGICKPDSSLQETL
jgi:hypothetical protein